MLICLVTSFCSRRTIRRVANYVRQQVSTSSIFDAAMRPMVVIDGREISWDELGRIVAAFEGWQFKLEFRDLSEEV